MGSFNDVWLCRQNGHRLTAEQEPWVNELFQWLKSILFWLAKDPLQTPSASDLRHSVGRNDASLSAFVGGDRAGDSMRGFVTGGCRLSGWRCLTCGYSEVSPASIDAFIAGERIPEMAFTACVERTLVHLIDSVLRMEISALTACRPDLSSAAERSGIRVQNRDGWMRPCPECESDNTAVYRWLFKIGPNRFEPAKDNLPMRRHQASTLECNKSDRRP
jgi:hypothetical protein